MSVLLLLYTMTMTVIYKIDQAGNYKY